MRELSGALETLYIFICLDARYIHKYKVTVAKLTFQSVHSTVHSYVSTNNSAVQNSGGRRSKWLPFSAVPDPLCAGDRVLSICIHYTSLSSSTSVFIPTGYIYICSQIYIFKSGEERKVLYVHVYI